MYVANIRMDDGTEYENVVVQHPDLGPAANESQAEGLMQNLKFIKVRSGAWINLAFMRSFKVENN